MRCQALIVLSGLLASCAKGDRGERVGDPADRQLTTEDPATAFDAVEINRSRDCLYPEVEAACSDGWCSLPAGCFIMGSPESEAWHPPYAEPLRPITLTHSFLLKETEVTRDEWARLGFRDIVGADQRGPSGDCREPSCPVTGMTWFDALAYANALSREEGYNECYRLTNCGRGIPSGLSCERVSLTAETLYRCEGYRLPSEAEWEYAARAGTTTAYFSGPITEPGRGLGECYREISIEPYAWYCNNSNAKLHPVKQKEPNPWGLFDMLGNALEFVQDPYHASGLDKQPSQDPGGVINIDFRRDSLEITTRGGAYYSWPSTLRSAFRVGMSPIGGQGIGFRLSRTLFTTNAPTGED